MTEHNNTTAPQTDKSPKPTNQPKPKLQQRTSTESTQTTLPAYNSLATDTPPTYTPQSSKPQEPKTAGASAATIKAILGDPIPEEPKRSLRDRLLCRRQNYNRRPPSSERRESRVGRSATWNVWGLPITDPNK